MTPLHRDTCWVLGLFLAAFTGAFGSGYRDLPGFFYFTSTHQMHQMQCSDCSELKGTSRRLVMHQNKVTKSPRISESGFTGISLRPNPGPQSHTRADWSQDLA